MGTIISLIGLLAAAVIFIVVIWKGLDVFTSTILVSFIIILTSWMNWWDALTAYADGYIGFIGSNLFVLVIGAVFGELMGSSGCAESIANVITEKLGVKRVILSITVLSTVFVYVGVSGFVVLFVLAPIATVMMKQAGYPYRMIPGITRNFISRRATLDSRCGTRPMRRSASGSAGISGFRRQPERCLSKEPNFCCIRQP